MSKDPNVVSSQQEEDDIAKAIQMSLQDSKSSVKGMFSSVPLWQFLGNFCTETSRKGLSMYESTRGLL